MDDQTTHDITGSSNQQDANQSTSARTSTSARPCGKNPGMSEAMKAAWTRRKQEQLELERLREENAKLKNKINKTKPAARTLGRGPGEAPGLTSGRNDHITRPAVPVKEEAAPSKEQEEEDDAEEDGYEHYTIQKKAKKVDKTVQHLQQVEQRLQHLQQARMHANPFWQILSQR